MCRQLYNNRVYDLLKPKVRGPGASAFEQSHGLPVVDIKEVDGDWEVPDAWVERIYSSAGLTKIIERVTRAMGAG